MSKSEQASTCKMRVTFCTTRRPVLHLLLQPPVGLGQRLRQVLALLLEPLFRQGLFDGRPHVFDGKGFLQEILCPQAKGLEDLLLGAVGGYHDGRDEAVLLLQYAHQVEPR
jgi:hypothetical protein